MIKKILIGLGGIILFSIFIGSFTPDAPVPQPVITKQEVVATTTPESKVAETNQQVAVTQPVTQKSDSNLYSVIKVVDGDTLSVSIDGKSETLRLIGIDTPETVDRRKPVQCFGKEASDKAKELLTGKKVRIEKDSTQGERDKYNRLLAYIYLENGTFFNKYMIEQGYAHEYTYNLPYKYQAEFKSAQRTAQQQGRGLWAPGVCEEPKTVTPPPTNTTQTQPTQTQTTSSTGDKDCADFKTQAEAQAYFDSKGGSASNNVDKLDGSDKDGKVCESLK